MRTQEFIDRLFDRAYAAGLRQFELCYQASDGFEATAHEGELLTYDVATDIALGFRAIVDGKMGLASTQILDEDALDQLIAGVRANAALVENAESALFYEEKGDYPVIDRFHPALDAVTAKEKIGLLLSLDQIGRSLHPEVTQLQDCGIFTSRATTRLVGSAGLDVSFLQNSAGLYVTPVARRGDQVNAVMKHRLAGDFSALDAEALARSAVAETVFGLGATPIASGSTPVIFRNDAMAALLRAFAPIFSAENAQKGVSLLKGKEGTRIASDAVTLLDDPTDPLAFVGAPFDDEGVPTHKKTIVAGGTLTTLLHNLKTARNQGVCSTGNASRPGVSAPIGVAPAVLVLQPGALGMPALLHQAGSCLVVTDLQGMHAGTDAVSGMFSLAAKGYLYADGAPDRPVSGITVAGNFYDLMRNVRAVGSDLWYDWPRGSCVAAPSVDVGSLVVAGA